MRGLASLLWASLVTATASAGSAAVAAPTSHRAIVPGDIVTNPRTSGGCPTFEGLLQVTAAAESGKHIIAIATELGCQQIPAGSALRVLYTLPKYPALRVALNGAGDDQAWFVNAVEFRKRRIQPPARRQR